MAATEFHYPNSGSPTSSWLPGKDPSIEGSSEQESTGIAAQLAADNATQHAEQLSVPFSKYVLHFSGLAAGKKAELKTFAAAVKGGTFDFKDCGQVGSSFIQVKFAREGFQRTWQPQAGGTWAVTIVLVDA